LLSRVAIVNAPLVFKQFRLLPMDEFLLRFLSVWHNWLFDIGSALTEVGDKVVVGAALGPQLLVPYFFGRKVGAAAAMVLEPYYVEQYRRLAVLVDARSTRQGNQKAIYARGLLLAGSMYVVLSIVVTVMMSIPAASALVPQAVRQNQVMFILVLLIECGIAANRWMRYSSHMSGKSAQLLAFRTGLCLFFAVESFLFGTFWNGLGICLAFFGLWLLESLFVNLLVRQEMVAHPSTFGI